MMIPDYEFDNANRVYDYTQYSHDNHVNVIPEEAFKRLVIDTFKTITNVLVSTYGPYGSTMIISSQNETTTTKDGYNIFEAMGFNNYYKKMVYLAIKKICYRVNRNVGDGTTSCILLAEALFKSLNNIIQTPDDKRKILSLLNIIEVEMSKANSTKASEMIRPLSYSAFKNVINLAGNYDDQLTDILLNAYKPTIDECDIIQDMRNVISDSNIDPGVNGIQYAVDYLPGKYRVRVNMDIEFGLSLCNPTSVRLSLYDHAFTDTDWLNFTKNYDKETTTIILARKFTKGFMDNQYVRYLKQCMTAKSPVTIILAEIISEDFQSEIRDLAAVLHTNINTLESLKVIEHESLARISVQVYKGNCLCFLDLTDEDVPTQYIETVRQNMLKDFSKSIIKKSTYMDRIQALSLKAEDTLITVTGSSSLEVKMIMDKIDDCTSIIKSSMAHGIVPNLLSFAYNKIIDLQESFDDCNDKDLMNDICESIKTAISSLLIDIWESKYGKDNNVEALQNILSEFYQMGCSFDIINEQYVPMNDLPTSAQYDVEVVVAAISIVKYLLTSRALIFDDFLMKMQGDQGHFA